MPTTRVPTNDARQSSAKLPRVKMPRASQFRWLLNQITRFGDAALTLLLPVECGGCSTPDTRLCDACITQLERECYPSAEQQRPVDAPFPVFAAAPYAGLTRDCIIAFKEQQRTDLRRPLGAMLARALDAALDPSLNAAPVNSLPLDCVPMPSPAASVGKRGYRHVELLAASMRPAPAMRRWLRATRTRADQVGLTERERQRNANASIRLARRFEQRLRGRQVILIDDIVTTGSSLRAAAEALERVGARVVAAVVVAHTERRFGAAELDHERRFGGGQPGLGHPQNLYGVPQGSGVRFR